MLGMNGCGIQANVGIVFRWSAPTVGMVHSETVEAIDVVEVPEVDCEAPVG